MAQIILFYEPVEEAKGRVCMIHRNPAAINPENWPWPSISIDSSALPPDEIRPGYDSTLYVNPQTGEASREYTERPASPEEQLQRLASLLLKVTADKMQIAAGGIDAATVTAEVPGAEDGLPAFVMVNGPPAVEVPIQDGKVELEISAEEPGLVEVAIAVNSDYGVRKGSIIIKAVE